MSAIVEPAAGRSATSGDADRGLPLPALVAGAAAVIFWSGTVVANRAAVASIDGLTAGALRATFAGVLGLGLAFALRLPFPKTARHRCLLVLSGWSMFAVWPVFLSLGVALSNASHAAVIMALLPVTTGLTVALADQVEPSPAWWLGAALALAGTVLLITLTRPQGEHVLSVASLAGDLILFAGVWFCSAGYVGAAKLGEVVGSWSATFYGLGAALLPAGPAIAVLYPSIAWAEITAASWFAIGWLTLLSSVLGYALWFLAMDRGGIARVAVLQFLQPVLSVVAAALLLGERITWGAGAAGLLIAAGAFIAQRHAHMVPVPDAAPGTGQAGPAGSDARRTRRIRNQHKEETASCRN